MTEAATLSRDCREVRRGGYIPGWNQYVRDAHWEARTRFKIWLLSGKPDSGPIWKAMSDSRKVFKKKLKSLQNNREQVKMDVLAEHHESKSFKEFWKQTKKLNPRPSLPVSVDGKVEAKDIANIFKDHFQIHPPVLVHAAELHTAGPSPDKPVRVTSKQVSQVLRNMVKGKSPGHDGLSVEHLRYAGPHLCRVLAMFFTFCIRHAYLPNDMMRAVVVPIVKNKTGDIGDKQNYRPITLATIMAKVLDGVLNGYLAQWVTLEDGQFGFRTGLSTESAILVLKHTVKYYTERKTPVYAAFLDLSKAFDLVNYDKLWTKLRENNLPEGITRIFEYWYSHQTNVVRWGDGLSDAYRLECGVRQGGLSSPTLFNIYVRELVRGLNDTCVGCSIDGHMVNNISYADDMVLLSPSISALRKLLGVCEAYVGSHGLTYNVKKSELLVFRAGHMNTSCVPPVTLGGVALRRVSQFVYLGHIVNEDLTDDQDVERERRGLSIRCNMLARRFARCSKAVKTTLFKAFCQSFYTCSLWAKCTQRVRSTLRVQYNNAFRVLMGLPRHCSASAMFAESQVDGYHAIIRKRAASLMRRVRDSPNSYLRVIAVHIESPIWRHWVSLHIG